MEQAYIVATARSPIGKAFKGSLKEMRPDDLAAAIVKALLAKVPSLDPAAVEDLMVGCAQPAGEQGYNIARVISLLAGLPKVPGTTVNRYCSSSLQTIRMATHAIRAGEGDVFIAGGVECVSRFQYGKSDGMDNTKNPIFPQERTEQRSQEGAEPWTPAEGIPDVYISMGQTAENVAQYKNVSREAQDAWAAKSQQRAVAAQESGFFADEITPIETPEGTASQDDCPRPGTTPEKLAGLKPVFRGDGTVTAGNACPLNDGAAAVLVVSESALKKYDLEPIARVVSSGVTALNPEIMGLGPIESSKQALERAGLSIDDIDIVEMNEAFAAQVVPSRIELGISEEQLNPYGGAIALGHPFGMTGARIMTTLLHGLDDKNGKYGLETMCVGGGQGMAMVVERVGSFR
jgi:acetyl-CoA C-acetyltransferase